MPLHDADVLVIGAGPAGASCAVRLARVGWRVTLVEQSLYPRHKVCGECLGAACLQLLDELGVGDQLRQLAGPEIRQVGWMTRTSTAIAPMPACPSGSYRYGRALGRDVLDLLMLDLARAAGVQVIQPARVRSIRGVPGDYACEYSWRSMGEGMDPAEPIVTISAAIVVDAHGSWEREPARPAADHHAYRDRSTCGSDLLAFKASFKNAALAPGFLPVLALPGGYGGMVVADRGRTTVACCLRRDVLHACRKGAPGDAAGAVIEAYLKQQCRGVARSLDGAQREGPWHAVGPLRLGFGAPAGSGMLGVGNAVVEAHPLIGEGICMALQSAALLASLVGSRPSSIDATLIRKVEGRYVRACRRAFAWRIYWARCCAQVAMRRSAAAPLAAVMQAWPRSLTCAARLAGKARRRSHGYA